VAHRLREEAGLTPFLDKWHLIPGEPWQEGLEKALEASETAAVFIGPSGVSPWHNEEMRAALDEAVRTHDEYRVIPVLLPGAKEEALTSFLARRTWVDFRAGLDDAEAFERLVAGILGQPPEGPVAFPLPAHARCSHRLYPGRHPLMSGMNPWECPVFASACPVVETCCAQIVPFCPLVLSVQQPDCLA
jgi:hypothetical protein